MIRVKVLKQFWDRKERCTRMEGDEFVTTDARAFEIRDRLPEYVELCGSDTKAAEGPSQPVEDTVAQEDQPTVDEVQEPEAQDEPDYHSLKVAELKALCAERGIEVLKRAKKPDLIALLEG